MLLFKGFWPINRPNLPKYVYFKEMNAGYKPNIMFNDYSVEINQN